MSLVLDSSAALAWIFPDEVSDSIRSVFMTVAEEGATVPVLWRLEVANSLTAAVRRNRISASFRNAALGDLALLNIVTDTHGDATARTTTLAFADEFRLTLYDAAYLELAHRRALPLASLDADLRVAGDALGLTLLGG